jgi:uncharacterized protein
MEILLDTPCKNICHLNDTTDLCDGCGRSRAEIASWISLTPTQRRAIMAELPARLVGAVPLNATARAS